MHGDTMFFLFCTALVASGVVLVLAAMMRRQKIVEMAHRERMAMIERGLTPVQTTADPLAFVQAGADPGSTRRYRMLSGGIVVIALGLALMLMIGVAGGAPEGAIGVGGAIAIIGAAFVVIGLTQRHEPPPPPMAMPFAPPPPRRDDRL